MTAQAQPQEAFVIDTSFIIQIGGKSIVKTAREALDGQRYIPTFQEQVRTKCTFIATLQKRGRVYCVPEVLRELGKTVEMLPFAAGSEYTGNYAKLGEALEHYRTLIQGLENTCFDWREEPLEWGWLKQEIFQAAKMPRAIKGPLKFGDTLQTDRHIITATIIAGANREVTCITRDGALREQFSKTIDRTIRDYQAEEIFPFPIHLYNLRGEEQRFNPAYNSCVYTPLNSFPPIPV